jgi:hypothetical protein
VGQIENKSGTNYRRTAVNQVDQHIGKSLRGKDGLVFYPAHNPKVVSSNLTPATNFENGLEDTRSEPSFSLPAIRDSRMSFCQAKGLEMVTLPICCPS